LRCWLRHAKIQENPLPRGCNAPQENRNVMAHPLPVSDQGVREQLILRGICQAQHPAIRLELFGTLRMRSGQAHIAMRADTIRTALVALLQFQPTFARLLPPIEQLPESHRFSINGTAVTTDLDTPLQEGDNLMLFSASVGG
jgi:molybdopterin converting factor small subunit